MPARESTPSTVSPASRPLLWSLLALTLAAACSRNEAPAPQPTQSPAPSGTAPVSAPFDVGAVIERVRLAYRPEGQEWRGGHPTYGVRVGEHGLTLTPFQSPGDASEAQEGAPLTLGPARLTRGGTEPGAAGAPRARVEEDGHLALTRGEVTEHLRNRDDGVEQSWSFDKAPAGEGDLLVRVPAKGLAYTGVTEGGLHFADARTGLGFRYGHATWVDATGRQTALKAEYAQGHIRLRVPAALLESSAYPALLDPVISPELGVDTPVRRPADNSQQHPALASNGTDYLVVWSDTRAGPDIFGARVNAQGTLLDPFGLHISRHYAEQKLPTVSRLGAGWLVVWQDDRNVATTGWDIYGARVSAEGTVLDADGLALNTATLNQTTPDVDTLGATALVVWADERGGGSSPDVYGARVSAEGTVLDGNGLAINTGYYHQLAPRVAASASAWYVTWADYGLGTPAIKGTRVAATGEVLEPAGQTLRYRSSYSAQNPDVASNGTDWLVVWDDNYNQSTTGQDVHGTFVRANGTTDGFVLFDASRAQTRPAITWSAGSWFVVWQDFVSNSTWEVRGSRISATSGTVFETWAQLIARNSNGLSSPAIAANGITPFVAWTDPDANSSPGPFHIYGTAWAGTGDTWTTRTLLSSRNNTSRTPRVAFNGTDWLVVWEDDRNGSTGPDIYGARVSSTGTLRDVSGLAISTAAGQQRVPDVAARSSDWLVVWEDYRRGSGNADIFGTRVTGAGAVQSPSGSTISAPTGASLQTAPSVAANGANWFVVWEDNRNNATTGVDIYGARITAGGSLSDPSGMELSKQPASQFDPVVASNGTDFLVAWEDHRGGGVGAGDVYATRVLSDGTVMNPAGLVLGTGAGRQGAPAMASDGKDWLVVWHDERNGASTPDIYGARMTGTGAVLDSGGVALAQGSWSKRKPSVAFGASDYLLVWEDMRSANIDIYGARVSRTGRVSGNPQGFVISANPRTEQAPDVAAAVGAGQWLITYDQFEADSFNQRIRARLASFNEPPVASEQTVSTDEDTARALTLTGLDPEGDPLTFSIASQPAHGSLSGTPPDVTYTPEADFSGSDTFTFTVRDGKATSAPATVRVVVSPVNDAPVATSQAVTLDEDTSQGLTLAGVDVDGDALTFTVTSPPAHGTLNGTPPDVTYVPAAHFHGLDSFTFTVTDPTGVVSPPATVSLTINPVNDAPVALAQSATTSEDTPVAVPLVGTDVDGDALTFVVLSGPAHGSLSGTPPSLTYTPSAHFHGSDSFSFHVRDASGATSAPAVVTLGVASVNDAPVALAQSVTTSEDSPLALTLSGTDVEGDALTFELVSGPAHGSLSGSPPNLTYTPSAHFHGTDGLTFTVRDSAGVVSAPATVTLTVTPVNDVPLALAQGASLDEDTFVALTLAATDADGDALTFTVASGPAHGSLSGTPPDVTYTPAAHFHGADSFTFTVTDAQGATSPAATVSLTVRPLNDVPVAQAQLLATDEDAALAITLSGSDADGEALTYQLVTQPAHGSLSGTAPDLTYTPATNYAGTDRFTFTVTDPSGAVSAVATVDLTVRARNDAPVALGQSAELDEDTAVALTLAASDVEGDTLSFTVVSQPAHGRLSGTPPELTYTPVDDFHGADSFTFRVNDGEADSNVATVSLTVKPVNDVPEALARQVTTAEDKAVALTLTGRDVDGDALTFAVVTNPAHGTLTGTPPNLTYTPEAHFHGTDSLTFRANDGKSDSPPATVTLTVTGVNDAPVADAQALSTDEDQAVAVTLSGRDADEDALTFVLVERPTHGTLTGTAPNLTYTPAAHYSGPDALTFTVRDSAGAVSEPATVSLTVNAINDAPVAQAQALSTDEDQAVALTLGGTDVEGGTLTFTLASPPTHGQLTGTPPDVTYTPEADFHGADSFTFTATDAQGATSAPATVSLAVKPVDDAPRAQAQSLELDEDTTHEVALSGSDVDGDTLTFTVKAPPEHGVLSGTPPRLTYTPEAHFHGTDSLTFEVSDGRGTASATVSLTVRPVNDAPVAQARSLRTELEPTALTLSATDVDGDALTYAIATPPEQGTLDGTPPEVTYTPAEGFRGTVTFTFTAADGQATSEPATVTLMVGNSAPVVALSAHTLQPDEGEEVRFQATAADANNDALTFRWDFGDGATSEEQSPTHAYANEGTYEVGLTVTDGLDTVHKALVLQVRNAAPVVVPLEVPASSEEGKALTFHAQATDSGAGDTLTFTWDFGDGSAPASGAEVSHTYADDGTYTVKVTVTDDAGAFTQQTREVRVANVAPVPEPVAAQSVKGGEEVRVQLKATDAAGERDVLTWKHVEGPGGVTPEGLYLWTPEASAQGSFPVRAQVADDDGATADVVFTVHVTAAQKPPPSVPPEDSGCGCTSGPQGAASTALLLVLAMFTSRRKRA